MSGMTRKEAIEILSLARFTGNSASELDAISEALDVAIEALKEQMICPIFSDDEVKQPCIKSPCGFERPHGEWLRKNNSNSWFECSVCKEVSDVVTIMREPTWNFCPNCGADMRRKEGEVE